MFKKSVPSARRTRRTSRKISTVCATYSSGVGSEPYSPRHAPQRWQNAPAGTDGWPLGRCSTSCCQRTFSLGCALPPDLVIASPHSCPQCSSPPQICGLVEYDRSPQYGGLVTTH